MRPRSEPRDPADAWEVQQAWTTDFEAPLNPAAWHVAVRRRLRGAARDAHINDKELGVTVDALRWAVRSSQTRRCRFVLQSDSSAAVGALRKGRSSRRGLLRHCRRLAALTLAEQLLVEGRWLPTDQKLRRWAYARPRPCDMRERPGRDLRGPRDTPPPTSGARSRRR